MVSGTKFYVALFKHIIPQILNYGCGYNYIIILILKQNVVDTDAIVIAETSKTFIIRP